MNSLFYRHEGPCLLHPNCLFNLDVKSYFVRPVAYKCDLRHQCFPSFSIQTSYAPPMAQFDVYFGGA